MTDDSTPAQAPQSNGERERLARSRRAGEIQTMFGRIVPRYDLMNRVMTGGRDGSWRRAAVRRAEPRDAIVLDLGSGTGDFARDLRRAGARRVIAVDFSRPMLSAARAKRGVAKNRAITQLQGDALRLPFADNTFDAVTSGFLLRNLVDLPRSLEEMVRVLKPDGRLVALDITHPPPGIVGAALRFGFARLLTPIAGLLSGDQAAYRYLPNSLTGFPAAPELAATLQRAGAVDVGFRRLGAGAVALHWGRKPARP